MTTDDAPPAASHVEYTRRMYANVLAWYESADRKAQVLLGFDGAFVSVLASMLLSNPDDTAKIADTFTPLAWVFATAATATLVAWIAAAVLCLWSRSGVVDVVRRLWGRTRPEPSSGASGSYTPDRAWFFEMVGELEAGRLFETLRHADADFEIAALSHEAVILARNVTVKHRWVNFGFVMAGCTLVLFVVTIALYVAAAS